MNKRENFFAAVLLIVGMMLPMLLCGQSLSKNATMVLEDFKKGDMLNWQIVNDGVMGGISQSSMQLQEDGIARFSGEVSLENNGGFASTRAVISNMKTQDATKIILRVKGDGHRYSFRIRTNNKFDDVSYAADFDTKAGEWTTHELLLKNFIPTFRGRQLTDVPAIDPAAIRQLGILIADKQEGNFELLIDWIKAE